MLIPDAVTYVSLFSRDVSFQNNTLFFIYSLASGSLCYASNEGLEHFNQLRQNKESQVSSASQVLY